MSDLEEAVNQKNELTSVDSRTAGALLREAREAAGLHVAALAVSMKVPVKKLEALEADRFDLLPDAVFIRALAGSVCRTLKIDAATVLDRLPQSVTPQFQVTDRGINEPFKDATAGLQTKIVDVFKRPYVMLACGFLLAALLILLAPSVPISEWLRSESIESSMPVPSSQGDAESATSPKESEPRSANVEVVPLAPHEVSSAAAAQISVAPVETTTTVAQVPRQDDLLTIRARGATWVQVVDAEGAVLLRRIMQENTVVTARGALPLSVVIGKADMAEVEVRGKPFAMSDISRDNVARFEVK
jgi:cytoskeleton protein RodZ